MVDFSERPVLPFWIHSHPLSEKEEIHSAWRHRYSGFFDHYESCFPDHLVRAKQGVLGDCDSLEVKDSETFASSLSF